FGILKAIERRNFLLGGLSMWSIKSFSQYLRAQSQQRKILLVPSSLDADGIFQDTCLVCKYPR
ncbi:MAG TPA: hypothetical protein VIJ75_13035, partial [Hanamia sp.]